MENYIYVSYLSATVAYALLLGYSILRKPKHLPFMFAALSSLLWCARTTITTSNSYYFYADTLSYETVRNFAWFVLLGSLLFQQRHQRTLSLLRSKTARLASLLTLFILSIESFPDYQDFLRESFDFDPRFVAHVVFAVFGLILVEQLYRSTPLKQRWNIKFLCVSLGALFAVDLLLFSKSLLFKQLDFSLWQSRGIINAILTPFLAITLPRLQFPDSNTELTVPRKSVFHSTILFGCGIYLILMSFAGFYIKHANEKWGETAQTLFIFLAIILLIIPFTSGKMRALFKIYFSKHFFHYSYDYREEWLKISKSLAKLESIEELKIFIINTLTDLVESAGGGLWLKNDQGQFFLAAEQNLKLTPQELEYLHHLEDLPEYLTNKQWVIDFFELAHAPEVYDDIDLSPWCYEDSQVWLIVPLFHMNKLEAFAVLTQARVPRKLDWEDHDLLKTVGMQLANALALSRASEELVSSRQFETYHRLSAYLVHDLKNVGAQIGLIVKNAAKHKHNPAFFDDTIDTLNNVSDKIQHIVEQLKQGENQVSSVVLVDLVDVIRRIIASNINPIPVILSTTLTECLVKTDQIKVSNVLANLIQNAQDASNGKGDKVELELTKDPDYAVIKIIDNGSGMDQRFIAERLFKPFDTTKGNAGMGIGAYEARDYVLKSGGQLQVDSTPGVGTTFTIYLPLAKRVSAQPGHND
ncbi:PEP-CTERM system histidine kinase PrsK [Methylococcaceae bacterium WWC4]|nr:PEP-CTERM system histidine kinase PrsK [Methylococcaceae bacterium WWC4]